ncbi:MAG TPA: hypothetical protein VGM81_08550 [Burkholderiaceae bacterium]|jgi:hypothetical protein
MNSWLRDLRARWTQAAPVFLRPEGVRMASHDAPFADWCAENRGSVCALIMSARLLHEMNFDAGLPLADDAARVAYARQQFTHYFGSQAQRWAFAAWSGGASALHGVDLAVLREAAQANDIVLRSVEPFWAPLLRRLAVEDPDWLRAPRAGLAWVEGAQLSWLTLEEGRLQGLRQSRLPAATQQALGDAVAELRDGRTVLVAGYGLDAGATPVWPGARVLGRLDEAFADPAAFAAQQEARADLPRPDFLGQPVERSALAWPLAAVGAVALGFALWTANASFQQRQAAEQRVAALQSKQPLTPLTSPTPSAPLAQAAPVPAPSKGATAEVDARAREVQGLLQQAWEPLLANVEQAGAGSQINWLSLDMNAARNELRLEGLTQDKLVALQLVDRLNTAPGWSQVILGRFQNGEQGMAGQRFELNAHLSPPQLRAQLAPAAEPASVAMGAR